MKILYMKNKKILIYKDILLRHNNNVIAAKKDKVYNNEDIIVRVPAKPSSAQFASISSRATHTAVYNLTIS